MLQERILHTLAITKDLDQRKLSRIAGVSESSFSRYLYGLENITLHSALKIVKYLYPDQEKEIMSEYVLTQKSRNARFALEYCNINNLIQPFKQLLNNLSDSVNPVDKEWVILYELLGQLKEKTIRLDELKESVELFNPKELEMQIMKQLFKAYISFLENDTSGLRLHVSGIEDLIKGIKSEFLKDCYNMRLGIIMGHVSLISNDIEETRYYCSLVINQNLFEELKALAYNNLGHTYMFDNYDVSKGYFETCLKLYTNPTEHNQDNREVVELNISFLQSYWKIEREFSLDIHKNHKTLASYIFYLIQKGDLTRAKEYASKVDSSSLSDFDHAFHYYYLGLIYQSKKYFYHSIKWFQRAEDFFRIQLPIKKLLEMGEDEELLSVWTD